MQAPEPIAPPPALEARQSRVGSVILLLLGPAAIVTGVFGSFDEWARERHDSLSQR